MKRKLPFLATLLLAFAFGPTAARAGGAPNVVSTWVTTVTTSAANLRAEANPTGESTTYRFEYTPASTFLAKGFTGAARAPLGAEAAVGSGEAPVAVVQHIGGLPAASSYRYRVVATNASGPTTGPVRSLQTDENAPVFSLPDGRGWELVSPVDKNGGEIAAPKALFGGGVLQAAAQGSAVTYGSAFSFSPAQGAPGASQYVSRRGTGGWSTENLTVPLISGGYPAEPDSGVPYQLFSDDLADALFSNGKRCRGDATACPVPNSPLPGSGAPAGYRNFYLRTPAAFKALLMSGNVAGLEPGALEVTIAGANADLSQVILSSCSALAAGATEVLGVGGECDPGKQNLYRWSAAGLSLVNPLPGAALAAQSGAISADGSRVYWVDQASGNLYLREDSQTNQVDEALGGGGTFQLAGADGSVAFFTKTEHLYRYAAPAGTLADLTPTGGVRGVLGASTDGSHVYYLTTAGLFLWDQGTSTKVAAAADASDYPPATGTARVSADGAHLAFLASTELTSYDNQGKSEVYVYSALGSVLTCASCNPSGERPLGPSSIPGAIPNGAAGAIYKPRALAASGAHLFFDSSDSLVPQDTDNEPDVYQWEAQGTGSCADTGGCTRLISSGRSSEGATFIDASADGADAFFLTDGSLVAEDPGAADVYDARVGGGVPVPEPAIPCVGDACQAVPGEVEDPTPATLLVRPDGNPPLSFPKARKKHHQKKGLHGKKHRKGSSYERAGANQEGRR